GCEIDVADRTVKLLQVFKTLTEPLRIEYLAGNEAEKEPDLELVEFLIAGNLHLANTILIVFLNVDRDVVPVQHLLPERQRDTPWKRRPDERKRPVELFRLGLDNRIQGVRANISVLGVKHADALEVVREFEIEVGVFAVENRN